MLPIILALFDRAPADRSRPTALHGQFVVGGPSRSEVRSDLNIIVRRSGKPPGHQAQTSQVLWPRAPERSCQEPPSICELPAPLASCPRDPGCAAPFSSRIPTGARTDSGEERKNDSAHVEQKNGAIVRHLIGYDRFASKAAYAQLTRVHEL